MGRVEGKVAIVTGGAQGIGRAICAVLAREGARVVLTDVNTALGEQSAHEVAAARFMPLDVVDEAQWRKVIETTVSEFGRLDILVNNAGVVTSPGPNDIENVSPAAARTCGHPDSGRRLPAPSSGTSSPSLPNSAS